MRIKGLEQHAAVAEMCTLSPVSQPMRTYNEVFYETFEQAEEELMCLHSFGYAPFYTIMPLYTTKDALEAYCEIQNIQVVKAPSL